MKDLAKNSKDGKVTLNDWEIKVLTDENNNFKISESRIDTNLLTSLITIKDSYMENIKISLH